MKILSVAIIGCGSRGFCYGIPMSKQEDKYKVVSVCDISKEKLARAKKEFSVGDAALFLDEKEFFKERRADVLVLATQDRDHVRQCVKALELGYDVLLEKPVSPLKSELEELLVAQKKYEKKVVVCHVLRYPPGLVKVKEILNSVVIGQLVRIESLEQVAYWHHAHSFVRGNWRNDSETSPMIMQKCCHDLDLIQYYVGAKCKSVYSVGSLKFFNSQNQPKDAANRCAECKYINECPYSAENLYIKRWKLLGEPSFRWPFNVVDSSNPNTEESIRKAYSGNQYGRCVFACDNNVVDNQAVMMSFENGVEVSLVMTAFTAGAGRKITVHGTLGEIELLDEQDVLRVSVYGKEPILYKISELISGDDEFSHGGGDIRLVDDFYEVVANGKVADTSLEASVESHLIALAAEESRMTGKVVKIHE
jgi:predicted dehydrogenase